MVLAAATLVLLSGFIGLAAKPMTPNPPTGALRGTSSLPLPSFPSDPTAPAPRSPFVLNRSLAWTTLSPTFPDALSGAGFAAYAPLSEGVLFGGDGPSGLSNATLLYNESANTWRTLAVVRAPAPRSDFAFATDAASATAYLFGGLTDVGRGTVSNETWDFSFNSPNWTIVPESKAPPPREDPALAAGDGILLLFGGRNPNASGGGELTYFDTWEFNLTTHLWKRVSSAPTISPPALFGASLAFDPAQNLFLLAGGCYPCSPTIWAFSPGNRTWFPLASSAPAPAPRMESVWAWDPVAESAVLFGGTNGTTAFNDSYLFDPVRDAWSELIAPKGLSPRWGSAADWLAVPANQTLLLMGGTNGSALLPGSWRLAPVASVIVHVTNDSSGLGVANAPIDLNGRPVVLTNASGIARLTGIPAAETEVGTAPAGYGPLDTSFWAAPGTVISVWLNLTPLPSATAVVRVGLPNGTGLANAVVAIAFGGEFLNATPHLTNATGVVVIRAVPAGLGSVVASERGYHSNETVGVTFPPGGTVNVSLVLAPLAELYVHLAGALPNGTVANLGGVPVLVGALAIGATDADGWLNVSTIVSGAVFVSARTYGFDRISQNVTIPFTGSEWVNLTLTPEPFPTVVVQVLGRTGTSSTDLVVRNAQVNLTSTAVLSTGLFRASLTSGADGTATFSPPPGNYSLSVTALGFQEYFSQKAIFAAISASVDQMVELHPQPPATVDVLVRSAAGGNPVIPGALVTLNYTAVNLSDGTTFPATLSLSTSLLGWANYTILPASEDMFIASAPGFDDGAVRLSVAWGEVLSPLVIELPPIPPVPTSTLSLSSGGPGTLLPLALVPSLTLTGAFVYLVALRNPDASRAKRPEPRPPGGNGPGRGNSARSRVEDWTRGSR